MDNIINSLELRSKRRKELFESVRECLENERRSPRYRSNPGNDSSLWFETSVRSNVFRSHFRMGRPTFNYIVDIHHSIGYIGLLLNVNKDTNKETINSNKDVLDDCELFPNDKLGKILLIVYEYLKALGDGGSGSTYINIGLRKTYIWYSNLQITNF
ncbi:hypothetical protein BLOT_007578 [Blomia tropicalis]|nr:hypothetical protein BLOT_007578 [Blomia tropicalis]